MDHTDLFKYRAPQIGDIIRFGSVKLAFKEYKEYDYGTGPTFDSISTAIIKLVTTLDSICGKNKYYERCIESLQLVRMDYNQFVLLGRKLSLPLSHKIRESTIADLEYHIEHSRIYIVNAEHFANMSIALETVVETETETGEKDA